MNEEKIKEEVIKETVEFVSKKQPLVFLDPVVDVPIIEIAIDLAIHKTKKVVLEEVEEDMNLLRTSIKSRHVSWEDFREDYTKYLYKKDVIDIVDNFIELIQKLKKETQK